MEKQFTIDWDELESVTTIIVVYDDGSVTVHSKKDVNIEKMEE